MIKCTSIARHRYVREWRRNKNRVRGWQEEVSITSQYETEEERELEKNEREEYFLHFAKGKYRFFKVYRVRFLRRIPVQNQIGRPVDHGFHTYPDKSYRGTVSFISDGLS